MFVLKKIKNLKIKKNKKIKKEEEEEVRNISVAISKMVCSKFYFLLNLT